MKDADILSGGMLYLPHDYLACVRIKPEARVLSVLSTCYICMSYIKEMILRKKKMEAKSLEKRNAVHFSQCVPPVTFSS